MTRKRYSSDLSDAQWALLAPLLLAAKPGGRPRRVDLREVVQGILYVLRSGCAWRLVPHDLPPWQTLYKYFRRWTRDGTWERVHAALHPVVRAAEGRHPTLTRVLKSPWSGKLAACLAPPQSECQYN